ncbi:MAG: D-aspartate ligase [Thermoleophilaceae bacterium]|nr:D-aspartate ligase [Thermoleophilaceae bacterium]
MLGRIDLVRALARADIASVVVGERGDPIRHSRHVVGVISREELFGVGAPAPLFYDSDAALQFVSREREALTAAGFRFVVPAAGLVDELLDKGRFQELAGRLELPVPRSVRLAAEAVSELRFPVVVKATPYRDGRWESVASSSKVLRVEDADGLRAVAERVAAAGIEAIAQELIPGGEERIESHHVYVDEDGHVAGEFTGRKIRTAPREFGMTTSLEITDDPELAALGREVVARLGLRGVAKLDFKRAPDGRLHLLEVNPRFTLWVHAGAVAGVNIPAIVHADLSGRPRPPTGPARPGVRWIWPSADAAAARERGIPLRSWLPWALRSETNSSFALNDPMPYVMGRLRRR